jgi:glycosyltransferase involved in cell wall biosynthesis
MQIIHISSDYPFTPLYQQLLMHYGAASEQQHVMYVPLPTGKSFPHKYDYEAPNATVVYSQDYHPLSRILYHHKRRRILAGISKQVIVQNNSVVHAHFLFSAGGIAYELKRTRNVPYVVAVRNTDLNTFFRYAVHLRGFGVKILQAADAVVFLSPAYCEALLERYVPLALRASIRAKSRVVPNGMSDYWLQQRFYRSAESVSGKRVRLAYVGAFTKNKNLETILQVVRQLRQRGYAPHLRLVGDGPDAQRIRGLAADLGDQVTFQPWTESQEQLLDVYRGADVFIMPSLQETFGLVYVEAMSQGVPVIHSQGQGIDGYFPDGSVGYRCNPLNPVEITDRVEDIIRNYDRLSATCTESVGMFSWHRIAGEYEELYRSVSPRQGLMS